jgi:hypothetical protein
LFIAAEGARRGRLGGELAFSVALLLGRDDDDGEAIYLSPKLASLFFDNLTYKVFFSDAVHVFFFFGKTCTRTWLASCDKLSG